MTNAGTVAKGPLDGVKVVDLTHYITGPYCTKLFADYGADVIKIERPDGGDRARNIAPFWHDRPHLEGSGLFLHLNSNKQSVTVNLKIDRGDVITFVGARNDVERVAPQIGYADRPTDQTDMVVMGAGIVIGALLGALTFQVGGVPLSLSTSGGDRASNPE